MQSKNSSMDHWRELLGQGFKAETRILSLGEARQDARFELAVSLVDFCRDRSIRTYRKFKQEFQSIENPVPPYMLAQAYLLDAIENGQDFLWNRFGESGKLLPHDGDASPTMANIAKVEESASQSLPLLVQSCQTGDSILYEHVFFDATGDKLAAITCSIVPLLSENNEFEHIVGICDWFSSRYA